MKGDARPRVEGHRRQIAIAAALTALACLYYLALLTDGDWNPFGNELCGLVFNDMLAHLLRGEVTIDKAIVLGEAYIRDGQTLAYWGIFPAFLRLPLVPFHALYDIQIARLSCWIAICLTAGFLVATLAAVYRRSEPSPRATLLFHCLVVGSLFAGIVVSSLGSAYVYNEPVFWAVALSVAFNYVVLRRVLGDAPLGSRDLLILATLAGLALNCRALEGIGLYLAMGCILLLILLSDGIRKVVAPAAILTVFLAICGSVNYLRWGSPFTFVDLHLHVQVVGDPERMTVLNHYGPLNVVRLPFSFAYYFFGTPLVDELAPSLAWLKNLYDGIEGPSSAFPLTIAVPLVLAVAGIAHVFGRKTMRTRSGALLAGVLAAQLLTIVLLLAAEYLAMRYRLDFLPAISLAAAMGYFVLTTRIALPRRYIVWALALTLLSVVASHLSLVAYKEELKPSKAEARLFWEHYKASRPTPPPASAR